jgi:hypothetical protein
MCGTTPINHINAPRFERSKQAQCSSRNASRPHQLYSAVYSSWIDHLPCPGKAGSPRLLLMDRPTWALHAPPGDRGGLTWAFAGSSTKRHDQAHLVTERLRVPLPALAALLEQQLCGGDAPQARLAASCALLPAAARGLPGRMLRLVFVFAQQRTNGVRPS